MKSQIRAFIASPVPDTVRRRIRQVQRQCREEGLDLRWVREEGVHLTLRFLGDIDVNRVTDISTALADACRGIHSFPMRLQGLGVFPTIKRPRVLWMGVAGDGSPLHRLHRRIEAALAAIGFAPEKRPYAAHLTIGRARGAIDSARMGAAIEHIGADTPLTFTVSEVVLYKSTLSPAGARHERLAAAGLPAPG